jgi:hypothetical protein
VSFKRLDGLQLPKYVIFIYLDLFSFFTNIWAILLCSGDTKLFCDISGKVPLLLSCLGISAIALISSF